VAPNSTCAILLYWIAEWQPKATIVKGEGAKWIAKSADNWVDDTELSFDQYRRALHALKQVGLVESHQFGDPSITHVRLTPLGFAQLELEQLCEAAQPGMGKSAQPVMSKAAQSILRMQPPLPKPKP
jgi:hypothetical protein